MKVIEEKYYARVGAKLKRYREEKGYTQKDVSIAMNKTQQFINQIESGAKKPSMDQILMFSNIYSKEITAIVGDTTMNIGTGPVSQKNTWLQDIDNFKEKLPLEIPVYKQATLWNPESKTDTSLNIQGKNQFGLDEPFDYIYWSSKRASNRREMFMVQVQTSNLIPDVRPNDRILFEKIPFSELTNYEKTIIAINTKTPRQDFGGSHGCRIVFTNIADGFLDMETEIESKDNLSSYKKIEEAKRKIDASKKILYSNHGLKGWKELKEKDYVGMAIQITRALTGPFLPAYEQEKIHVRSGSLMGL